MEYILENIIANESAGETPFSVIFFRLYDQKIASGEITFSSLKMSKNDFTALCMDREYTPAKETIVNLCNRMHLDSREAEMLLNAAGYTLQII